jgi:hypothetical protein
MCIVIDTNTFASVFDRESEKHPDFKPVLDWIIFGNGKAVIGGSKYREELRRSHKYLRIFIELSKKRKVMSIDDESVDKIQVEIEKKHNDKGFNDPHIPAIIIASGCRLICSGDKVAYQFFKRKNIYPKNIVRPKIYSKASNADLLNDKNIVNACKPVMRLPKEIGQTFLDSI